MHGRSTFTLSGLLLIAITASRLSTAAFAQSASQDGTPHLGAFDRQSDIGAVNPPGEGKFDPATGTYSISAAGANIWGASDAFHFIWKKVSGDVALAADIVTPAKDADSSPHRKAVLMFRQDLENNSVYADAAQHGSGLTALQYRRNSGDTTQDIELNIAPPQRLRLEKRGDTFTLFVSTNGEALHPVGASIHLHLQDPFYVGLGLSAHDASRTETASFTHVQLETPPPPPSGEPKLYSTLQTIAIDPAARRATVAYSAQDHFEAPNWTHDGKTLIVNMDGKIVAIPAEGGSPRPLDIGAATRCNGSHGISPDGKWLAISCAMPDKPESRVYIVPITGGTPRLVTQNPNSYWHAWSPDGKTIYFTRPTHTGINIYAISAAGGDERPITSGSGTNDDPDCSPDGRFVYFHSDRSGTTQIWRMHPDGSHPEQITSDNWMNRTPHVSPDGKTLVMLSYSKDITGRLVNQNVSLRLLSLSDNKIRPLVDLVGGAGTINVPSWAPDSQHLAFVSYQELADSSQ